MRLTLVPTYDTACLYTPRCHGLRTPVDAIPRTPNRHPTTRDETDFRIRPGKVRDRQPRPAHVRRRPNGFLAEVH